MSGINPEDMEKDLLPLLSMEVRPQVRSAAMQMVLCLTGTKEGIDFITSNIKYLEAVSVIACHDQPGMAKDAFCALINLAAKEEVAWQIIQLPTPDSLAVNLLQYVLTSDSLYADIVCSLLSNLSRSERCSQVFVELMVKERETIGFDKVIEAFCKKDFNPKNSLHYLGPFLSNLTQISDARKYVLDKERCVVQRLLPYTEYKQSDVRRGGIIGVLHNCCFESAYHTWLLGDTVDILPCLLLPLAGPEEFDDEDTERLPMDLQYLEPDKTREPDPDIRRILVQAIYQLCSSKPCRMLIKEKNAYVIMRELFNWEKDPVTRLAVENLVQMLIGDEPEPGLEDLRTAPIPEHLTVKIDKAQRLLEQEAEDEREQLKNAEAKAKDDESTATEGER